MRIRFVVAAMILVGACVGSPAGAGAIDAAGTQSPFVLGTGAREQALGRAGVALTENADALFWNPARLALSRWPEIALYRSQLFVSGSQYHAGFVCYPTLDFGTLALGLQHIAVDGIERRDERNRILGEFSNGETNILLGYGRQTGRWLAVGGALRIAQQSVDAASDASIGLDVALALERPISGHERHRVGLGANLQNALEPRLRLDEDTVADPRSLKLGLGYSGGRRDWGWAVACDVDMPRRARLRAGGGAEFAYRSILALRLGLDDGHSTFGVGVHYRNVRFDYALRADQELARNDRFSLALHFGPGMQARRADRQQAQQARVAAQLEQALLDRERNELERALQAADAAHAENNFDAALRMYRRVLALDPENDRARVQADAIEKALLLAEADGHVAKQAAAQAASAYQRILERWPDEAGAQRGLAQARAELQRSADRDRTLRELFSLALEDFTLDEFSSAEATLLELLRIDSAHDLGRQLLERVRRARAERGTRELAAAQAAARTASWDAAFAHLREARRDLGARDDIATLEPEWIAARRAAAERDRLERDRQEQRPAALAEDPAPAPPRQPMLTAEQRRELERKFQDGMNAFSRGDFDAAIRSWRAIWIEAPVFPQVGNYLIKAYLFEGVELYGQGRYDEALDRCRRVLEIDPQHHKARRYLERIQEEKIELETIESRSSGD